VSEEMKKLDECEVRKFLDWFFEEATSLTWWANLRVNEDGLHWFSYEGEICIEKLIEGIKKNVWKRSSMRVGKEEFSNRIEPHIMEHNAHHVPAAEIDADEIYNWLIKERLIVLDEVKLRQRLYLCEGCDLCKILKEILGEEVK